MAIRVLMTFPLIHNNQFKILFWLWIESKQHNYVFSVKGLRFFNKIIEVPFAKKSH